MVDDRGRQVETAKADSLTGIELLADLPDDEVSELRQKCSWLRYDRNEQILDRESDSRDVFFVVKGRVQVRNFSFSGREIALATISEGGYFGELSAVDQQPRSASVLAAEPSVVASLGPNHFIELIRRYPILALRVLGRLAQIVRDCDERIMDLSTLGAVQRVYVELLRLANPDPAEPSTWAIYPMPTQTNVAARASTTRETVARVYSQLRKSGLITLKGKTIYLNDHTKLEVMAERLQRSQSEAVSR